MTVSPGAPLMRGRLLALVGIVLVASNLRTAVSAISPIIDIIGTEISLDPLVLAVIGSAPPLFFALSGFITPAVARRLGLEATLIAALVVAVAGHLIRGLAPDSAALVLGTALALLGTGAGNVLLPPIVKRYFPARIGTLTAVYVMVLAVGASVPPAIAVPLAEASSWRVSLGVWSATALVAAIPWIAMLIVARGRPVLQLDTAATIAEAAQSGLSRRLFRSPIAWSIALLFGNSAINAYAIIAWHPQLVTDISGVNPTEAGLLLAVFAVCGVVPALFAPVVAVRFPSSTPWLILTLALFFSGYGGFLLAPTVAPLLWTILVGLGPLLFPLALTLINLHTRTHAGAVALSGFVQGVGYIVGATGPFFVGVLHDVTGGWVVPLWFLIGSSVLLVPGLIVLRERRFVEDELPGATQLP